MRAERAKAWKLVDDVAPPSEFAALVREHAAALAASSPRSADAQGIALQPLARSIDEHGYHYSTVDVTFERAARRATITVRAPGQPQPDAADAIVAAGDAWWPLALGREPAAKPVRP